MTGWVRATGAGDAFRSPYPLAERMDEVGAEMGPGGICESCHHAAHRHSRLQCRFHELDPQKYQPCPCSGMLWKGERLFMDPAQGPLRPAALSRTI